MHLHFFGSCHDVTGCPWRSGGMNIYNVEEGQLAVFHHWSGWHNTYLAGGRKEYKTSLAKIWMCVPPHSPNLYAEILTSKVDGIRRWGFWEVIRSWWWSPHEWNGCSYKRNPSPFRVRLQWHICDSEECPHPSMLNPNLGFPASRILSKKFLLYIRYLVCAILLQQPDRIRHF